MNSVGCTHNPFQRLDSIRGERASNATTATRYSLYKVFRDGLRTGLLGLIVAVATPVLAASDVAPDIAAGQKQFMACASCHGTDGQQTGNPRYPKIGGQNVAYLAAALKAYRDGKRTGTEASLMAAMAKPLSDADITNLAAYISTIQSR
ncbi:c-type cytochrome [Burkholderia multivorans]|uniref:c-type cytochrome n=1 Tax=Burkholderia multivorans TaxID=87883 RepID=UPI001C22B2C3|nr:c-type cytochrome [Burkholderia multivorans]MBU9480918.1 c-type cytochrome [Burkholderia multivorans]